MNHSLVRLSPPRYSLGAQRLFLLVFWFGGLLLSFLLYWQSVWAYLDDIEQQNRRMETQWPILQRQVADARADHQRTLPLKDQYDQFSRQVFDGHQIAMLLQVIEQFALSTDINVTRIEWLENRSIDELIERQIHLELAGDFFQLMAFIDHLQQRFPIMYSDQLIWRRIDMNQDIVALKMNVYLLQPLISPGQAQSETVRSDE
jgi:Tfp pilus assembly protein PilO